MIQETEDDRLDQSLRDTFSDFDLPPSGHVWSGIEGHLSTMPRTSWSVPRVLLLPVVGLIGVTVGWLMPRPEALRLAPQPRPATQKTVAVAASESLLPGGLVAQAAPVAPSALNPAAVAVRPVRSPSSSISPALPRRGTVFQLPASGEAATPIEPVVARLALPDQDVLRALETTGPSSAMPDRLFSGLSGATPQLSVESEASIQELPSATAAFSPIRSSVNSLEQSAKGEGLREWRPEYRVPTHRLAERGRGLRRVRNTIAKQWQHLFGPRRSRLATQSRF